MYNSTQHWIEVWVRGIEVMRIKDNGDVDINGVVNQNAF
jgi:hypothetical protein